MTEVIMREIEKLCETKPEDFVIGEVIAGIYRMLEKRGMSDKEIVRYVRDRTQERCVGGLAWY